MVDAARVPHSQTAMVFDDEEMDAIVNRALDSELPGDFRLPFVWGDSDGIGGPAVHDPLTIDFSLSSLSAELDVGPAWRSTLEEILTYEIRSFTDSKTGAVDEEDAQHFLAISRRLREMADFVESSVKPPSG